LGSFRNYRDVNAAACPAPERNWLRFAIPAEGPILGSFRNYRYVNVAACPAPHQDWLRSAESRGERGDAFPAAAPRNLHLPCRRAPAGPCKGLSGNQRHDAGQDLATVLILRREAGPTGRPLGPALKAACGAGRRLLFRRRPARRGVIRGHAIARRLRRQ
jgi:hypothetical protein